MKTWIILLFFLSSGSWAQVAKTDGDDCINCEGPRPVMNASLNLMDSYYPNEEETRILCGAYFAGLRHRRVMLNEIGLTEEQFFQNYDKFICDRRTLPVTHLIVTHATMDVVELEKDLVHLEGLDEDTRFELVNRVVPGRRSRGTQLDMIQVHLDRIKDDSSVDPQYILTIRRIRDRFIEMGAKTYSELTRQEEQRLGYAPINPESA